MTHEQEDFAAWLSLTINIARRERNRIDKNNCGGEFPANSLIRIRKAFNEIEQALSELP
jgi:hypothetical protein